MAPFMGVSLGAWGEGRNVPHPGQAIFEIPSHRLTRWNVMERSRWVNGRALRAGTAGAGD